MRVSRYVLLSVAVAAAFVITAAYWYGYLYGTDAAEKYTLRHVNAEIQEAVLASQPFFLKGLDIKFVPRKGGKTVNVQIAVAGAGSEGVVRVWEKGGRHEVFK